MSNQPTALAFDIDADCLGSLGEAFPGWRIEEVDLSSSQPLTGDSDPRAAQLLVVGARDEAGTVAICRGLRSRLARMRTPLLVLVPAGREGLVRAVLEAGANGCLIVPVHPKSLVDSLSRAQDGNQPGRHTLDLDRAQREDQWRDEGGEA